MSSVFSSSSVLGRIISKLALEKTASGFAPGLPSRRAFPELPEQRGKRWLFAVQHHAAERAGDHRDLRLVDDRGRAFSWALKGELPKPGESRTVIEQPVHTGEYATWEGVITSGYGKGSVALEDKADVDVLESRPGKISFVIPRGRVADEFTLVRIGDRKWLLVNHSTTADKYGIEHGKPKYKSVEFEGVPVDNANQVMAAKIGGAHSVVILERGKHPRVFSYRASARGLPLEYTHKMPMEFRVARWNGPPMVLRGEVYGIDKDTGRAIHESQLGGILNSTVDRAHETMASRNIELRLAPFMVWKLHGRRFSGGYDEHLELLRMVQNGLPATKLPPMAVTPEQKVTLLRKIESGELPETREGVVLWDRNRSDAQPVKAKIAPDFDVWVRGVFMEKGRPPLSGPRGTLLPKEPGTKYVRRFRMPDGSIRYEYGDKRERMAAGFVYSLTPRGPVVGKVGTGMSHSLKRRMADDPKSFIGLVARVRAQEQYPSGALAKPSFKGFHWEKSLPKTPPRVDR